MASEASTSENAMEVYIAARPFQEWGRDFIEMLPKGAKEWGVIELGLCHYMTLFRTPEGRIVQFDFGPFGRDVQINGEYTGGEIRETELENLPDACMFLGLTNMTLSQIQQYNAVQSTMYELHNNDCRHYVNNLIRICCGMESASHTFIRHVFAERRRNRRRLNLADRLIQIGQVATDASNWHRLQAIGRTAMVLLMATITWPITSRWVPTLLQQSKMPLLLSRSVYGRQFLLHPHLPRGSARLVHATLANAAASASSWLGLPCPGSGPSTAAAATAAAPPASSRWASALHRKRSAVVAPSLQYVGAFSRRAVVCLRHSARQLTAAAASTSRRRDEAFATLATLAAARHMTASACVAARELHGQVALLSSAFRALPVALSNQGASATAAAATASAAR